MNTNTDNVEETKYETMSDESKAVFTDFMTDWYKRNPEQHREMVNSMYAGMYDVNHI